MRAQRSEFCPIVALQQDNRLQPGDSCLVETFFAQLRIDVVETYFIEFIDGDGNIDDFLGRTDDFGNAAEYFPIVEFHGHPYAEPREHLIDKAQQFYFVQEGIRPDNIGIALEKLAVATFLRPVGPPYGLYLVAFERE